MELQQLGKQAKGASAFLAQANTESKNRALTAMGKALLDQTPYILEENAKDMDQAKANGTKASLLDRLLLTEKRLQEMADGLFQLAALPDPIGEVDKMWLGAEGIKIGKIRVPLGVVGIIYEARPNVTADVAGICLKTGNAVLLRGSQSALQSNKAVVSVLQNALEREHFPKAAVSLLTDCSRETASKMMKLNEYLDILIPRGGAGLIRSVVENATVPVLETGVGNCHVFVDESADFSMAEQIILNAKCQRPGVCNAIESLLVHQNIASEFLPRIGKSLTENGVEIRGDETTRSYIQNALPATEEDYLAEYNDLILAVKVVASFEEAVSHINRYGSGHSEAIITESYQNANRFTALVDAAAVYVNASTRFTDGFQFGFGAEMGISTQKLHARGPLGLSEMTTTKYIIFGEGQTRK